MKWYSPFNPMAYWRKVKYFHQKYKVKICLREEKKWIDRYDADMACRKQSILFRKLGLDYELAQRKLHTLLSSDDQLKEFLNPENYHNKFSEHMCFFTALQGQEINSILEIGTFNGETACLLSILFPSARIVTVDLPDDAPAFINSYGRSNDNRRENFISLRSKMLDRENITFIQENSFNLPSLNLGKFDLVWVDACHEYPEVAWDTCNAWHLCKKGGWMAFDDIYLSDTPPDGNTNDSRDALFSLKNYGMANVDFILKRLSPLASANPNKRKHIGIIRK